MNIVDTLALTGAAGKTQGGGPIELILMMVIFMGIWYVVAIRPKTVQEKKKRAAVALLKKSDPVMLEGGIFGEVDRVENDFIMVKIADKTIIKVHSRGVSSIAAVASTDSKEVKKTKDAKKG